MQVTGGCHCGQIAFEAKIDPETVGMCHCADCQKLSGSAFRVNVPAREEDFRITTGTAKEYIKTGDSGARRAQGFCANCGAQIYAANGDGPRDIYMLRVGAIDQRDDLAPKRQIWRRSALSWLGSWPDIPSRTTG